ncbi:hypothetical protein C8J57DRAFT_1515904 [Mycena rebaudengoi]|nr:hypothetical protein C8J57DRAFT_1515904 [Mycena rebaudengoi]
MAISELVSESWNASMWCPNLWLLMQSTTSSVTFVPSTKDKDPGFQPSVFQGNWVNGEETALPDVQECGSVTQTPGSSITSEFQGLAELVIFGRFPPDPTTITAALDGAPISLTPITTANPTGCNNLLYTFTVSTTSHKLTLTLAGSPSNNNFLACVFLIYPDEWCSTQYHRINVARSSITSATTSASVIPSNSSPALPVTDTQPQSSHSKTRAKLGGAIGGAVSVVAILVAVGTYLSLKAPAPGASPDYEFAFLPLVAPITFRGKTLQTVQVDYHRVEAPNLAVTDEIPGAPSTYGLLTRHDVAWKVHPDYAALSTAMEHYAEDRLDIIIGLPLEFLGRIGGIALSSSEEDMKQ